MSGKRSRSRWFALLILTGVGLGALLPVFLWQPLARAGDLDEEPLPQEEQPGWFIKWETYDEPGDNTPIDGHPAVPANGGMRIFPGKKTDDDAHVDKRRLVFAVVEFTEAPPAGTKMWFRLWDVDDPSASAGPIDEAGSPDPGTNGPDNRDESWAMAGVAQQNGMILVQVGKIKRFDRLDDCDDKHCKVAVRVGMQPGDNWRFCAAKEEDEAALRGMTQNQADRWQPPPRVAESRMLTTWRKLHVERDSMGADYYTGSSTALSATELTDNNQIWMPQQFCEYNEDWIVFPKTNGTPPLAWFDVVDNWGDRVIVPDGSDMTTVAQVGDPYSVQFNGFGPGDASIGDVHDANTGSFSNAFATAYVAWEDAPGSHGASPWHYNFDWSQTAQKDYAYYYRNSENWEGPTYWAVYIAGHYEAYDEWHDNDPNVELGLLGFMHAPEAEVAIVLQQTILDVAAQRTWSDAQRWHCERLVALHEVGHQFELPDREEADNIMWAPDPANGEADETKIPTIPLEFCPEDIATIRSCLSP